MIPTALAIRIFVAMHNTFGVLWRDLSAQDKLAWLEEVVRRGGDGPDTIAAVVEVLGEELPAGGLAMPPAPEAVA